MKSSNNNDTVDADGIVEAVQRPTMSFEDADNDLLANGNPALEQERSQWALLRGLREEWKTLAKHREHREGDRAIAAHDDACQRLTKIPGVGPLVATALVAAVGNASTFAKGRDLAAWLGLVPSQYSTGGRTRLGITKRANLYVRRLLIHRARSVLISPGFGRWLLALQARAHPNVVVVARANKLARIAWAVLARQERERYRTTLLAGVSA
jgi:transposase